MATFKWGLLVAVPRSHCFVIALKSMTMFETRRSSRIDSCNILLEIVTLISFLIMDIVQYPKSTQEDYLRVVNRDILLKIELGALLHGRL